MRYSIYGLSEKLQSSGFQPSFAVGSENVTRGHIIRSQSLRFAGFLRRVNRRPHGTEMSDHRFLTPAQHPQHVQREMNLPAIQPHRRFRISMQDTADLRPFTDFYDPGGLILHIPFLSGLFPGR